MIWDQLNRLLPVLDRIAISRGSSVVIRHSLVYLLLKLALAFFLLTLVCFFELFLGPDLVNLGLRRPGIGRFGKQVKL